MNINLDKVLNYKNFEVLKSRLSDPHLRQNIKILCVFGCGAAEVIYVTLEDEVYCYGRNRFGGLGLGSADVEVKEPQLNPTLSFKEVSDIIFGFEHWLALTTKGQVYAWGHNQCGQLGIGCFEATTTPKIIKTLTQVVQISCGGFHTLALTTNGQVFTWGDNRFGQLGTYSYESSSVPINIFVDSGETVVSVSCGKKHSMVLTSNGRVYIWGINGYGQCGHSPIKYEKICRPQLCPYIQSVVFSKAICGPNHSLLLTTDGFIYSFGENTVGQIGNDSVEHQFIPNRIREDISFKDIVTNKENDLSIAVAEDNRIFVWGLANNRRYMSPIDITSQLSLFDIYAKYAKNKIALRTVNVYNELKISHQMEDIDNELNLISSVKRQEISDTLKKDLVYSNSSDDYFNENDNLLIGTTEPYVNKGSASIESTNSVYQTSSLADSEPITGVLFLKHLHKSFNDRNTSDLIIRSEDEVIYCHKTILQIRNKKFWSLINDLLTQTDTNSDELLINSDSFKAFLVFIEYLYGIEPEIDVKLMADLMKMSEYFEEPELKDLIDQQMKLLTETIDLSNVCHLYETAINSGFKDLEESCLQFAVNNWKTILRSDSFDSMDDKLSKRFMLSINMR